MTVEEKLNGEEFVEFLRRRRTQQVRVDGHPAHRAAAIPEPDSPSRLAKTGMVIP